jgi:hypothetical protein
MPDPYRPKTKDYVLSNLNDGRQFVRIRCPACKKTHHYFPTDLIAVVGDIDVDSLMRRMKCGCGGSHFLDVSSISPTGSEAVGMKIRRLVAIKVQRVPVWRED